MPARSPCCLWPDLQVAACSLRLAGCWVLFFRTSNLLKASGSTTGAQQLRCGGTLGLHSLRSAAKARGSEQ